jgi:hypothetical protein
MRRLYSLNFEVLPNSQEDKRKVVYSNQECSFDMDVSLPNDFTLMLGCAYLGLDVLLSSLEVVNISGFCPNDRWIKKTLCLPSAKQQGTIKIISESGLCNGTGTYLFEDADMYFDENSGFCYIDGRTQLLPDFNVRFCENAIFSLCGDALVGIWIQLIKD